MERPVNMTIKAIFREMVVLLPSPSSTRMTPMMKVRIVARSTLTRSISNKWCAEAWAAKSSSKVAQLPATENSIIIR